MNKRTRLFNLLIITALFLGACNLRFNNVEDPAGTAAAQTVQALLISATSPIIVNNPSSTPLPLVPATLTLIPTPISTNTLAVTATSNCNVAQFISDVTIPDGSVMIPGQAFTKIWRLKNIGACTWTGFSLVFDSGNSMAGPASKAIGTVNPNAEVDLDVNLIAPAAPGSYKGNWRIVTDGSVPVPVVNGSLGKTFYVDIKVQNAATATNTLPPAIIFAVTSVTFSVTGTCGSFSVTVNITTNGAGTVNLHRVWSDASTDGAPRTLIFASAGSQSFTESASFSSIPSMWEDIYIDTPNHQQFGRATFTCP